MTTTTHIGPGGQPAIEYHVLESRIITGEDPSQAVVAGRSNDGIHLLLTAEAANVLASILIQHEATRVLVPDHPSTSTPIAGYDADLWTHVAIDLMAARAMALNADTLGQDVVYATLHTSGHLPPRRRRLQLVDAGSPR